MQPSCEQQEAGKRPWPNSAAFAAVILPHPASLGCVRAQRSTVHLTDTAAERAVSAAPGLSLSTAAPSPWHAPPLSQADGFQHAPVFVFDPLDPLQLGVHNEGPALCVAQDGGILGGHAVTGEALVVPRGHVRVVCQQAQGIQAFCDGDGNLPSERGILSSQGTVIPSLAKSSLCRERLEEPRAPTRPTGLS